MVFYDQPIFMGDRETPSGWFFAEQNWFVAPVQGIDSKEQAAFGAWAIARYQKEFLMYYYSTIKKFVDEDMLKPAEELANLVAENYLNEKLTDYKKE
jgi:hypothetical protein